MAKDNQLKVQYRDGSVRIIQVSPEFFNSVALFDHKIGKMSEWTAREKSLSIADSCGKEPYIVELFQDSKQNFIKTYESNKPIVGRAFIGPKDSKQRKKDLRKKFKNVAFTISVKWNELGAVLKEQNAA